MKEFRIEVPNSQHEVLVTLITSYNLNYKELILVNTNSLFIIKVEENQTNELLHELRSRGVGEIFGEISIYQMNLYVTSSKNVATIQSSPAANVEEILANIEDTAVLSGSYLSLVVLSAILASFGLLSDSVVIIIGSMIVAPLLGPVALTSIGVLVPGRGLFAKGIGAESVGIFLTVFIGLVTGVVLGIDGNDITQQMTERAAEANAVNNIIFAIVSGLAAGLIISKGQSLSIVGVAIAASLAPPAATIGLYLSLLEFENALLAGLLLFINILAINASCSIMFGLFKLPSKAGVSKKVANRTSRNMLGLTIIVILAFGVLSYAYLQLI